MKNNVNTYGYKNKGNLISNFKVLNAHVQKCNMSSRDLYPEMSIWVMDINIRNGFFGSKFLHAESFFLNFRY